MTKETIHIHLPVTGQRLDSALSASFPDVSRAQIQQWIKNSQVKDVTGKVITTASFKNKTPLDIVVEREHKKPFEPPRAEEMPDNLVIVYEDDDLLVINKPAGISVHPGAGRRDGTLVNMLMGHTGGKLSDLNTHERPGIVHRLDKDTSGLMVVAKTNRAHAKLADALQKREIKRVYQALVWNVPRPASETITTLIGRDPKNRQRMAVVTENGKEATTHYQILKSFGLDFALVECRLETGRTHQIRVHLASIGCPIIGDPLYAGHVPRQAKRLSPELRDLITAVKGQMLHAGELRFQHPFQDKMIDALAEPPAIFAQVIAKLNQR